MMKFGLPKFKKSSLNMKETRSWLAKRKWYNNRALLPNRRSVTIGSEEKYLKIEKYLKNKKFSS